MKRKKKGKRLYHPKARPATAPEPSREAVLYSEHATVVLDEKIRSAVRASVVVRDLGASMRLQCGMGSALCSEITASIGTVSGTADRALERQTIQLQVLAASHAAYAKHQRILADRIEDVLRYVAKIRLEVSDVDSARAFKTSLLAMDADGPDFRAACNQVLKRICLRDPHLMSLVRCDALRLGSEDQES